MSKSLLVFSYHYPPSPEVGAVRWHRMGSILARRGWDVSVVAVEPESPIAHGRALGGDEERAVARHGVVHRSSLLLRLVNGLRPNRSDQAASDLTPGAQPASHAVAAPVGSQRDVPQPGPVNGRSEARFLRTLVYFAQDHQWALDAARAGRALAQQRILLSAGPPHAIHYWVSRLARRRGLPHVVDLRDQWSLLERSAPWVDMRLYRALSNYMESRTVRDAALIVCNTGLAAEAMKAAYPAAASRIIAVMNGADPEDTPAARDWQFEQFQCVHSGTIYLDRMPLALLRGAREAIDARQLQPSQFRIAFRGVLEDSLRQPLESLVASLGLSEYVETLPRIPRDQALKWTAEAQMCVVLPQDSRMALPSKVFELAQLPSWMLVFAPHDSATATALRGTTATVIEPDDATGAAQALVSAIDQFRQGRRPQPVDTLGEMQRAKQVDKLESQLVTLIR